MRRDEPLEERRWNHRRVEIRGPAALVRDYFNARGCVVVPPGRYGMLGMRDAHYESITRDGRPIARLTIYWRTGWASAQYDLENHDPGDDHV